MRDSKIRTVNLNEKIPNSDLLFLNKIRIAVEGLDSFFEKILVEKVSKENALTIAQYIQALKTEINLSLAYRRMNIMALVNLSNYLSQKDIRQVGRVDIVSFLDSLRRPEPSDPMHKWIGYYNLTLILLIRFFKWLHFPTVDAKKRSKPPIVENIPKLKRKEQSIYKPTDLWTQEEDLLFLKYSPNSRDRCYHAISRDLSSRPHEILNLRLKDIVFKTGGNYQYAEVLVNGKTGSRPIPLISSIPYLKDWIDRHPQRGNPNAFLIPTLSDRSYCKKMSPHCLNIAYRRYKIKYFPDLLGDPSVPPEDKRKLTELLKKPFNPYLRRHIGLTEKSKMLKENMLKRYAGWSGNSQMHLKYLHYFGNESSESLLEAYGLKPKAEEIDKMKPKPCPNCNEPNKPDSKFCGKCRMVLSYDAYTETIEEKQQKESEVKILSQKYEKDMKEMREDMDEKLNKIMSLVQQNPKLVNVKPESLKKKLN